MEDLLGSLLLTTVNQNGLKISPTECCFNERAGECRVVRFTTQFFVLDKSKSIPIRIGGQTAWEAVRNDFIETGPVENKEKIASRGVLPKVFDGGVRPEPRKTLTLFQTKMFDFRYPVSDQILPRNFFGLCRHLRRPSNSQCLKKSD